MPTKVRKGLTSKNFIKLKESLKETKYSYGRGRRKRATARAKYYPTSENIKIYVNGKPVQEYTQSFYSKLIENFASQVGVKNGVVTIFVNGGGLSGQVEASRLATAKAIVAYDEAYKPILRMYGYLTTDIRIIAPKKAGLRKNRKKEQWSKR